MDPSAPQTILLADDCFETLKLYEQHLSSENYVIAFAENGKEAVEMAHSSPPDVIVMDVNMPEMDGIEAARILRDDPTTAAIPIIMASANTDEADIAAAMSAGADEYIFKPIRAKELCLRIRSMTRLRRSYLQLQHANSGLRHQAHALTMLHHFHEATLIDDSVEAICQNTVEVASKIAQSQRVSILLPVPSSQSLRFAYAIGLDEHVWRELVVPLTSPIAGKVFTSQREIVADNDTATPPTIGQYESQFFLSLPIVSTPLRSSGGSIGVLNVTGKQGSTSYDHIEVKALRQLAQAAAMALENTRTRQKLDQTRDSIIFSMAKLSEYRHPETGHHLERVRDLSVLLAQQLATDPHIPDVIDRQFIMDLRRAAPLHDIGKVATPDFILCKPGKLTEKEFRTMQQHTSIGAETLRSVITRGHDAGFLQMAMDIAHYHHERFDGTGYPAGLRGDEIPLSARIVCLADSYDAIRMPREYKPARSHQDASEEIRKGSGLQFDPRVSDAHFALTAEFEKTYQKLAEEHILFSEEPVSAAVALTIT